MDQDPKQFEQNVKALFDTIEKQYPGVSDGMRVLNMSYKDYLTILENSQPASSFTGNGTFVS